MSILDRFSLKDRIALITAGAGPQFGSSLTEGLAHSLMQKTEGRVTAHLLVPGFTFTGMIRRFIKDKPPSAWTPEQVADFLFDSLARGDFYILCPDNETPRALDEKRIQWTADDLIKNRPALSRWHPEHEDAASTERLRCAASR